MGEILPAGGYVQEEDMVRCQTGGHPDWRRGWGEGDSGKGVTEVLEPGDVVDVRVHPHIFHLTRRGWTGLSRPSVMPMEDIAASTGLALSP